VIDQRTTTVAVVAGGLFLAVTSTTVVSVALPTIGQALHARPTDLQWIVDAYVIVYASLLVAGGVLGDRWGRKGLFLIGLVTFGAGSLVSGLAPTVGLLLAGRVLQGLGPAMVIPGSLTIIRATFEDPRRRGAAIGLWSMASGLALALGPMLGGVLVEGPGWRWAFLFNVPLTAVLLVLAARYVPRLARTRAAGRFDWPGLLLSTAAVAAISFALIHGQAAGMTSPVVLATVAAAAAALAAFVGWERRIAEPLIDVTLFLRPGFAVANAAALVVFFSFVGALVYFSAYLQQVRGHAPIAAGADVSAMGAAYAIGAPLSGRLVGRVGPWRPMLAGLVIGGLATLGLLRLGPQTGMSAIWWNFALVGVGMGLCLTPMTQIAVSAVEASRAGMASAVHNALRQVGQVLGVAVLGLLVFAGLPEASAGGRRLDPSHAALFVRGLHHALWVSGLALLAAALATAVAGIKNRA
jgi:DHA2 family methylenomycin A resistance protein-like MFS transporter